MLWSVDGAGCRWSRLCPVVGRVVNIVGNTDLEMMEFALQEYMIFLGESLKLDSNESYEVVGKLSTFD